MKLNFTKMHSIGNDFVMLDLINQNINLDPASATKIADRHFGIGCDQIIVASPSKWDGYDYWMRIYNSDGSEVEQCGNGARCFARFLKQQGLIEQDSVKVHTSTTPMELKLVSPSLVKASLSLPNFEPQSLPMQVEHQESFYSLDIDGQTIEFMAVSMGNPHAVILVDDVENYPVEKIGSIIQQDAMFPNSVNVGFMQIIDANQIKLRVFERGVGETLGCGSGACAAVSCGHANAGLAEQVRVELTGGCVDVELTTETIWLKGETTRVFDGVIDL